MKMEKILISDGAYNSNDLYPVVFGNSKVIAYLLEQGVNVEDIHPVALASYYVDYYFSQVNTAGLAKFVHHSQWNNDMNDRIAYGLETMKAFEHLKFFNIKRNEIDNIPSEKLETYLENGYHPDEPLRVELDEDKRFYWIDDEIVDLNGQWLKEHKDTEVLSMDEIFLVIEEMSGKPIKR